MASHLPPSATYDEIAEELDFTEVLISSLDYGADNYASRLEELESIKADLERRLQAQQRNSRPQISANMDGSNDSRDSFWQTTLNGRPPSNDGSSNQYSNAFATPSNSMKRTLPHSLAVASEQHRSKRPTPDPSNANTPTSSNDSSDAAEISYNDLSERARMRQLAAESAFKRQREQAQADEQYARSLSQQHSRPSSSFMSSARPGIQTTIGHGGSFIRPLPPVKPESPLPAPTPVSVGSSRTPFQNRAIKPEPYVKSEPSSSRQQLVQRPRQSVAVVDLTGSDDESDDIAEITPYRPRPSDSTGTPVNPAPNQHGSAAFNPYNPVYGSAGNRTVSYQGPQSMPGAYPQPYPNLPAHPVYGNGIVNAGDEFVRQRYQSMRRAQLLSQNAIGGVKYGASGVSGQLSELSNLFNGSRSAPFSVDDDDDLVYNGYRQRPLGEDPLDPYAGYGDLYRNRFDTIAAQDPAKTKEEINALLANIRPDEGLPEHLRIQTPESMTIQLHKYQEMGLTWLKNCEEGTNMGGILADDMGLGKTIQMLSLLVTRRSEDLRCKTTLIVAPVALLRQWKQEIESKIKPGPRHALTVFVHHGQAKKKDFNALRIYDVVITTYGSIAAEVKKLEAFRLRKHNDPNAVQYPREKCVLIGEDAKWYRVILDEAQCIKNRGTQTAKAAYLINAKYRFCMTGTPMMNNVDELFSLIHFLRIKPYCVWEKFRVDFSTPLKSPKDTLRERSMHMLQALCKAVMIRRTKKSTFEGRPILVLPDRTTEVENPVFNDDEQQFYTALEQRTRLQFNRYVARGTVGQEYSAILVLLLRLRQAACHPHLIRDFGVSSAADITPDDMLRFAKELSDQIVARIKEKGGAFECCVCYDVTLNPAIFIPCGHDTCSDCFARITDPANAIAAGNENGGTAAKCPNCRGPIDSKRVTDFASFKRVHQPELLTKDELANMMPEGVEDDSETESDDEDSETQSDEEDNNDPTLGGFIIRDDVVDSETESEGEEASGIKNEAEDELEAGPSTASGSKPKSRKEKGKKKKSKKSKKAKGKEKKKSKTPVTLAELKKLANRSAAARKQYLRKLRKDWVSSAKIDKTLELLTTIMNDKEGEKVLIFSQWTSLLDLLEIPIEGEGWGYRRYDGSMNARMRGDAVDDFRDPNQNVRIMMVSLKAGNAGLNLNMASQVIILDPFWNPFIEEQAIDRAHRIGQNRPVKVHRVLVKGTVEDRIIELQEKKRELISEALDEKASQNIGRLGVRELAYLFGVTNNANEAVPYRPQNQRR